MEKWEAEQTSKNGPSGLTASSALVHFQVCEFIIVNADKTHPYVEVPAPPAYISGTEKQMGSKLTQKSHLSLWTIKQNMKLQLKTMGY